MIQDEIEQGAQCFRPVEAIAQRLGIKSGQREHPFGAPLIGDGPADDAQCKRNSFLIGANRICPILTSSVRIRTMAIKRSQTHGRDAARGKTSLSCRG
jgi:hypothetical protein